MLQDRLFVIADNADETGTLRKRNDRWLDLVLEHEVAEVEFQFARLQPLECILERGHIVMHIRDDADFHCGASASRSAQRLTSPPCGEGLGVGVVASREGRSPSTDPPPQPSPTRGEGVTRLGRATSPTSSIERIEFARRVAVERSFLGGARALGDALERIPQRLVAAGCAVDRKIAL